MKFNINSILAILAAAQSIYEIGKGVVKTVKGKKDKEKAPPSTSEDEA